MNRALRGEPLPIFGDGLQTRAFSHVSDVAPIIARSPLIAEAANETFNIGADEPHTVLDLAAAVSEAMGVDLEVEHLPAREEVVHAFSDHTKVRNVFGEAEPVSLPEGLVRMAAWVKERGPMSPVEFEGEIEVDVNLPPSWQRESTR